MATPNESFLARKLRKSGKEKEMLLDYYDSCIMDEGNCPVCGEAIDVGEDDGNHQEVVCDCGFRYCVTCQYIFT